MARATPTDTPSGAAFAAASGQDDDLLAVSRALGDPTRHAVFVYVRDAPAPVSVAELTEHFGVNHNAIRQHLAHLAEVGLVRSEAQKPSGPGRPAHRYRATPGAAQRWGGTNAHEALAMMLVELLRTNATPREVGRVAGRRLAAEHRGAVDTVEILEAVARRLGFEPNVTTTGPGVDVVLDRCPFAETAAAAPDVICDLHHGIAEGIAEQAADGAMVDDLIVHPPHRAGCRIKVSAPSGGANTTPREGSRHGS